MDEKRKSIYLTNEIAREANRRWAILSYNIYCFGKHCMFYRAIRLTRHQLISIFFN